MDPYTSYSDPYGADYYASENSYGEGFTSSDDKTIFRRTQVPLIASAVAAALLALGVLLSFYLWRHAKTPFMLAVLVLCVLAFLFACFCAYFFFAAARSLRGGGSPPPLLAAITGLGAAALAAALLLALIGLAAFGCFHEAALAPQQVQSNWSTRFGAKSAADVAARDKRIWLPLMIAIAGAAAALAVAAAAALGSLSNSRQTAKIVLMITLPLAAAFGLAGLAKLGGLSPSFGLLQGILGGGAEKVEWLLAAGLILAAAAAAVNAFLGIVRSETARFLMGCLWVAVALVLIFAVGLLLRSSRRAACGGGVTCRAVADIVPANGYKAFCPGGKYLPPGQSCRKVDLTTNWEETGAPAFLNPSCCGAAGSIAAWPLFLAAALAGAALAAAAASAAANFAHVDPEKTNSSGSRFDLIDLITAGLVAAVVLAGLLWLLLVPKVGANSKYAKFPPQGFVAAGRGGLVPSPAFAATLPLVKEAPLPDFCYRLERGQVPLFGAPACGATRCGYNVGLLAKNARFRLEQLTGELGVLGSTNREVFFPTEQSTNDDYVNLYGTAEELNRGLGAVVVCQADPQRPHSVIAHALPADLAFPASPIPSNLPPASAVNGCAGPCVANIVSPQSPVTLAGRLLLTTATGRVESYGVPEAAVELAFGLPGPEGPQEFRPLSAGSYDVNGRFTLSAPAAPPGGYKGIVRVTDPSGHYQPLDVDVFVPGDGPRGGALLIGDLQLTTLSGAGCKQQDLLATMQCFEAQANMGQNMHRLSMDVREFPSGRLIDSGLYYSVRDGFSSTGALLSGPSRVAGGAVELSLPAGAYTIEFEGDGYSKVRTPVIADRDRVASVTVPRKSDSALNIYMQVDNTRDPRFDYDLNLKMRAEDGSECIVSSANPVCPWARKVADVGPGEQGIENIQIDRFARATYMAYVSKGPAYGTCPQVLPLQTRKSHAAHGFFSTNPLYSVFTDAEGFPFGGPAYPSSTTGGALRPEETILGSVAAAGGSGAWAELISSTRGVTGQNFGFRPQPWVADFRLDQPVKVGSFTNIPLILQTLKTQTAALGVAAPDLNALLALHGGSSDSASLLFQSLPILYSSAELSAWAPNAVSNGFVPLAGVAGARAGLEALRRRNFALDSRAVDFLAGSQLEAELAVQNKRFSPAYNELIQTAPLAPRTYAPGLGEEGYLFDKKIPLPYAVTPPVIPEPHIDLINDYEVGLEAFPPMAPNPSLLTNDTAAAPALADLVGVELNGQASIYVGNRTEILPSFPASLGRGYYDLCPRVPAIASRGFGISNTTVTHYTWIIPTTDPSVITFTQDQLGLTHVAFKNGSVFETNVYNETTLKHLTGSRPSADGSHHLDYTDGSSALILPDGRNVHYGPDGIYTKLLVPVNQTTLLASIGHPVITKTTAVVSAIGAAPVEAEIVRKNLFKAPSTVVEVADQTREDKKGFFARVFGKAKPNLDGNIEKTIDTSVEEYIEVPHHVDPTPIDISVEASPSASETIEDLFGPPETEGTFSRFKKLLFNRSLQEIDGIQYSPAFSDVSPGIQYSPAFSDVSPGIQYSPLPVDPTSVYVPMFYPPVGPESTVESNVPGIFSDPENSFETLFCFNGFGAKSIKPMKIVRRFDVDISECEKLYPATDSFSIYRAPIF